MGSTGGFPSRAFWPCSRSAFARWMRVNQSSSTSVGGLRTGYSGFGFVIIGSSTSWVLVSRSFLQDGLRIAYAETTLPGSRPGDLRRGAVLIHRVPAIAPDELKNPLHHLSSEPPHEKRRCDERRCNQAGRKVTVCRPGMPHGEFDRLVHRVRDGHRADEGEEPPPGRHRGRGCYGRPIYLVMGPWLVEGFLPRRERQPIPHRAFEVASPDPGAAAPPRTWSCRCQFRHAARAYALRHRSTCHGLTVLPVDAPRERSHDGELGSREGGRSARSAHRSGDRACQDARRGE